MSVLGHTLAAATRFKIDHLQTTADTYEAAKAALLQDADAAAANLGTEADATQRQRARLTTLLRGARDLPTMTPMSGRPSLPLDNMLRIVWQSVHDPTVRPALLDEYEARIRLVLDMETAQFGFAALYGALVNEWLATDGAKKKAGEAKTEGPKAESGEDSFVSLGRKEQYEQRAKWESYAFHPKVVDTMAITAYLEKLFAAPDAAMALETMRENLKREQKQWDTCTEVAAFELKPLIKMLLRGDTLSEEKRKMLSECVEDNAVLTELAEVLALRMRMRKTWRWAGTSTVQIRKQMNGRYRFYPDDDLLDTLFVHFIGLRWSITMRRELVRFRSAKGVWNKANKGATEEDLQRRKFFLGNNEVCVKDGSVAGTLDEYYDNHVFLNQLPESWYEVRGDGGGSYGQDSENGGCERYEGYTEPQYRDAQRQSFSATVQGLLHIIQSVVLINQAVGEETGVVRSDYEWFGPSLSHDMLLAVLEFLGINDEWRTLFRRILEAPIKFADESPDANTRTRLRGTMLSTPFADLLSESMLFCLDFAVNQTGDGAGHARFYRLHDDMWLLGSPTQCAIAWSTIAEFNAVMGLDINEEKTGSVCIGSTPKGAGDVTPAKESDPSGTTAYTGLPRGQVKWGFLKLDAASGRFVIDRAVVDTHIDELRIQLLACTSVLDMVHVWNSYAVAFFRTNLGQFAKCYSREHVDAILATFGHVQAQLFGVDRSIGTFLKDALARRFSRMAAVQAGSGSIPDGFLYLPIERGGLGVVNPFVTLLLLREDMPSEAKVRKIVMDQLAAAGAAYRAAKKQYEEEGPPTGGRGSDRRNRTRQSSMLDTPQEFMTEDEYNAHRLCTSVELGVALDMLRGAPCEKNLTFDSEVAAILKQSEWNQLPAYGQWVTAACASEMQAHFAGMQIVGQGLLPIALVTMMRKNRFQLHG